MPVEFVHDVSDAKDAYKLLMAYDGSGRRVSKTRMRKDDQRGYWYTDYVTHYTGIGTEVRESIRRAASPEVKVVVNLPQGLGRYGVEDAADPFKGIDKEKLAGYIPSAKFEWYLKNHLGSTMLVYGTSAYDDSDFSKYQGGVQAAYDYRAFGEQVDLEQKGDKVTENFTGKERDDETELNYFGARYLDPMLGLWVSVDPKRQFVSPYLYMGNGVNPIIGYDPNGNEVKVYSVEFRASAGIGLSLGLGYVRNTENPNDCGILFSIGFGAGTEIGVLPNTVPSTLMQGAANSLLDNKSIQNAHDLEGVSVEIHAGLGVGAKLNGNGEFQNSEIGSVGGGVYVNKTSVITLGDLLGDESRTLLPTSGPAPSDNTNVAVPNLRTEE